MPTALENFLLRNSVVSGNMLPLIHSTKSYNLKSILQVEGIDPQECDVFLREKINYFFVGRPSYKYETDSSSADHWELPCCFIFESTALKSCERIFPFDSGAFSKKRFPDYIDMMPIDQFRASSLDAPQKIIGSFFGSARDYFFLNPKSADVFEKEFSLTPFDAEIQALRRLAEEKAQSKFDDRRFAIEIQSRERIDLSKVNPIAVVLPEIYLDMKHVRDTIQLRWGAEPLGYPMFSLSVMMYHALIYKAILEFYQRRSLI